jgi:hypothetical protein
VQQGFVRAGFAFEGRDTSIEFEPSVREVVMNTAFTQVVPKVGLPFNVSGGVFNFKNVTIPQGVLVRGQGPNPMVWLCTGDFRVAGELSVRGGNGQRVDTLNSANYAKAGGIGVCGGGNGGDGTPAALTRDQRGANGNGPLQNPGRGGGGGRLACTSGCYTSGGYNGDGGGSGGGGGSLATQGDPWYRQPQGTGTGFQQRAGIGGAGCSGGSGTRTQQLPGGEAGPLPFTDNRQDNNFWGAGINYNGNLRVTGELEVPMGGGGGGGGGDTSPGFNCTATGNSPPNDFSGGGGGGGGGVLIVKALGEIEIMSTGRITANGGHGGGGEQVGASGEAGGGGGGSGGMIILMSAKKIILHAHGSAALNRYRYSENEYDFALSADGGVCTTGTFGSTVVMDKYPASGTALMAGSNYDSNPLGGFGGMGIVQLMTPPGENQLDGTNTRLDDNIEVRRTLTNGQSVLLTGSSTPSKTAMLAWRGFPNASGTFVDDQNVATNIGLDEGDIRPAPILMPVPFNAKSRLRSKWLDTGVSERRGIPAADGLPRGLALQNGAQVGPAYEFAGLNLAAALPGYLAFERVSPTAVSLQSPLRTGRMAIESLVAGASYQNQPAYRLRLAAPEIAETDDRFVQHEAELRNAGNSVVRSYRILSHTNQELLLAPDTDTLPTDAVTVQIRAKFFKVITGGSEGLGTTYPFQQSASVTIPVPNSNLRIGFAFHQDPQGAATGRYPADPLAFEYDLDSTAFQTYLSDPLKGPPRYVQWDITFDMAYSYEGSVPPTLGPSTPRPELHWLRLPFRF